MKKLIAFALFLVVSLSSGAATTTDTNMSITSIGVQGTSAYLNLSPAVSGTCLYGIVYIQDLSTASGKSLYVTLLTAYSQGKLLQRVDYAPSATGECFISLIQVGP